MFTFLNLLHFLINKALKVSFWWKNQTVQLKSERISKCERSHVSSEVDHFFLWFLRGFGLLEILSQSSVFPVIFMVQMWVGFEDNFQFAGSFCHVTHFTPNINVQCSAFDCFGNLVLPLQSVFNMSSIHYIFSLSCNFKHLWIECRDRLTKIMHIIVYKLFNSKCITLLSPFIQKQTRANTNNQ